LQTVRLILFIFSNGPLLHFQKLALGSLVIEIFRFNFAAHLQALAKI